MNRWIVRGLLAAVFLSGMTACQSVGGEGTAWRDATLLVLGEGTPQAQTYAGESLSDYMRGFTVDDRTDYRAVEGSRTGYLVVDGLRYRVTASREATDGGRDLLTIHSGSTPLHLKRK